MPQCSFDSSVNVMRRRVSGLKNNSLKVSLKERLQLNQKKASSGSPRYGWRMFFFPLTLVSFGFHVKYFIDIFSISPDGVMMFIANG
ncbi:unnamed protein product [Caenorhabditis auriculariae]|uniref:Uncharacterized protein n=1 Tax=Caenorhabditis auriculariae TaxID=2777116 RepID=A0A8S1HRE5_9PELO|nr:unnamed protein product [Caenorhabditis auriculariae]